MKYAKDATEFNVKLSKSTNKDGSISYICRVPKRIINSLGDPNGLKFRIRGKTVVVEAGEKI